MSRLLVMASPGVRGHPASRPMPSRARSLDEIDLRRAVWRGLVRIGPGLSRHLSHVHMEIQARAGGIANGETGRTATGMPIRGFIENLV